jgi:energy-coupling factor transporter ATP-binding protein EcfA2
MTNLYDFNTCIRIIEKKGKEYFGDHFRIIEEDHPILARLLAYFFKDEENAKKMDISLQKGVLLSGPVGCGKTSLMTIFRLFYPEDTRYQVKSCRDVCFEFSQEGYTAIYRYSRNAFNHNHPRTCCFDDLGTEQTLQYYGNSCNVMAEILLSRYDMFTSYKMITHITTNLASKEIEELYGLRVRSRMREMFNLVSFGKEAKDKRA